MFKNRNFKVNGKRYVIIESNATFSRGKWQAMLLDTERDMWIRTRYYANTQAELIEKVKDYERMLSENDGQISDRTSDMVSGATSERS